MPKLFYIFLALASLLCEGLLAKETHKNKKGQSKIFQKIHESFIRYLNTFDHTLDQTQKSSPPKRQKRDFYCIDAELVSSTCDIVGLGVNNGEQNKFFKSSLNSNIYDLERRDIEIDSESLTVQNDFLQYQQNAYCSSDFNCFDESRSGLAEKYNQDPINEVDWTVAKASAIDGGRVTTDPNSAKENTNPTTKEVLYNTTLGIKYKRRW